nr:uncharacterized protein LOC112031979 [Quercus suber]
MMMLWWSRPENGFVVKRVMIDQGSGADVMYPDLYRGLGLKKEDLLKYDTPLMGFDGRMVIPEGQIVLPMSMEGKKVTITFTMVASFSPYTVILGRPWIHLMGGSTVHLTCESQVLHEVRYCYDAGKPASGQAMHGSYSRLGNQAKGIVLLRCREANKWPSSAW